jgi:Cu(I)/Ag(I) efflux system membrane protein CusA/SilA
MIGSLIRWSTRNPFLVLLGAAFITLAGIYAVRHTALDAIPDLSDTQVIVYTEYPGQAPQVIEDQVTYPLTTALLAVPRSKVVRGFSFFGVSFVYVVFEDGTDLYWARSRVLEYLNFASKRLPAGVTPSLGPDATGVGWVYQYVVLGAQRTLAELRTIQDWTLRYQLTKADGVAEVASVGGFVQQYQVVVDPQKLQAYGITLAQLTSAIRDSNRDVGGRSVEMSETEYIVRGRGYIRDAGDVGQIALKMQGGTPVLVRDVARVELGPEERRGVAELNGEGEVVGGIALQRDGQNALNVIDNVKQKLAEIAPSLPEGVTVRAVYDRSDLIYRAIAALKHTLAEESIIVALVCVVFLLHVRSALVAILMLPVGVLIAMGLLYLMGLSSNIMSLGGVAIALGAMVDAAIVMIENAHKHLERAPPGASRVKILTDAALEVGPALFFSLAVITVSFLPVFTLEDQEGRLFKPLAFTKTFAMGGAALLSVTLVPVLMQLFVRGRILPEARNPINRALIWLYRPVIAGVLKARTLTILLALLIVAATVIPLRQLGSEFMPTLNEGTLMYMPVSLPGMSVTKAAELLQTSDRIIKSFPEVSSVFGKSGRAATATDPAPLEARIDMLSTGIRTPIGIKVYGPDLPGIDRLSRAIEAAVRPVSGTSSVYAERVENGYYLEITPDRPALARYGLTIGDLQETVAAALGGEPVTTTVEGRERYTVNVRYPRGLRDDPQAIATQVLVQGAGGPAVPLGEVAKVQIAQGPPMIRTENAQLVNYIYVDMHDRDIGSYVADAQRALADHVTIPPGYHIEWSGQFEYLARAKAKLQVVVPITLVIIFVLLYLNFGRLTETLIVMLSVPFALVGGIWLMVLMHFNMSVAVAVGFIALAGVAAETGVVMLIYLDHALRERRALCEAEGRAFTREDLTSAIMSGAVERVRPKMMTVCAIIAGLLPILWSHGTGTELMQRIAVPMIGGMVSSTVLTLVVIPAVYGLVKGWGLAATGESVPMPVQRPAE